jgi:predicted thioesterase
MSLKDMIAGADLSPENGLPAVPAASRMIGLMELAAARLMKPHLESGESSVGISTNVTHAACRAATGTIRAVATHEGISGRTHRFTIHAFDETGLIGSAEHARTVVADRKLLALARPRVAAARLPAR